MFCVREQRWIMLNRGNESSLKFICHLCIKHSATPRAAKAPHRPLTCGGSATASTAECGLRRTGCQPLAACGSWSPANDLVRWCSFRMEELATYVTCFGTRTNTTDLDCLVYATSPITLPSFKTSGSTAESVELNGSCGKDGPPGPITSEKKRNSSKYKQIRKLQDDTSSISEVSHNSSNTANQIHFWINFDRKPNLLLGIPSNLLPGHALLHAGVFHVLHSISPGHHNSPSLRRGVG